jgi:2-(1,2-epoxy-1,2-dihydrophenyl)acetyl-CoA isomerase
MAEDERISLHVTGGLGRLRLVRAAKRNAIDEAFLQALEQAVNALADDRRVRVVLLEADGPSFCAGFDLAVLDGAADEAERKRVFGAAIRGWLRRMSRILDRLYSMEPVTIAAVQGAAAGGGFSLALACDLRIVARDARCWFPEVELGSALSPASTALLMRLVPAGVARDIILVGRRLDAAAMLALGMANRVSEPAALAADALAYAGEVLARPAGALLTSKATINAVVAGHAVVRPDLIAEREEES